MASEPVGIEQTLGYLPSNKDFISSPSKRLHCCSVVIQCRYVHSYKNYFDSTWSSLTSVRVVASYCNTTKKAESERINKKTGRNVFTDKKMKACVSNPEWKFWAFGVHTPSSNNSILLNKANWTKQFPLYYDFTALSACCLLLSVEN